jgi:hypothetical protein
MSESDGVHEVAQVCPQDKQVQTIRDVYFRKGGVVEWSSDR